MRSIGHILAAEPDIVWFSEYYSKNHMFRCRLVIRLISGEKITFLSMRGDDLEDQYREFRRNSLTRIGDFNTEEFRSYLSALGIGA